MPNQPWVEFRNNVIHKGTFPTAEEATDYGQFCLDHIIGIRATLQDRHKQAMQTIADQRAAELSKASPQRKPLNIIRQSLIEQVETRFGGITSLVAWLEDEARSQHARERWRAYKMIEQIEQERSTP